MNVQKQEKGFTIIEVVLVLAIAALIFLMIFVALPALQRGQRDTARKNDANAVASQLNAFRSNNNGRLPTAGVGTGDAKNFAGFKANYLTDKLAQVDLTNVVPVDESDEVEEDQIGVILGHNCDGDEISRAAAVWVRTEASNDVVCTEA